MLRVNLQLKLLKINSNKADRHWDLTKEEFMSFVEFIDIKIEKIE